MKQKILYGILAVAISFGLWWYVVTVVSPEFDDTFYDIPVVLSGETFLHERGLMVLDEKLPTVTGKQTVLESWHVNVDAGCSRIRFRLPPVWLLLNAILLGALGAIVTLAVHGWVWYAIALCLALAVIDAPYLLRNVIHLLKKQKKS